MRIEDETRGDIDGRLVNLRGEILQIGNAYNNQRELIFRYAKDNHIATLPIQHPDSWFLSNIPHGQPVELTGIIILTQAPRKGEYRTPFPNDFRLLLRNEDDIRLLPGGPWLTPGRRAGLQSAGILLIFLLAATITVMRYRIVRQRQQRREADLLQEERKRIAADLHDSLEQDITASDMQMRTALMALKAVPEEAADCIHSALYTIAAARIDLRNSLWNLQSNAGVQKSFTDAMAEISKRFDRPGKLKVVCTLDPAAAYLHEYQSVHLLAIISEAITNAVKHGNASHITIATIPTGITITDNGSGFDPQQLAAASDAGHFGIINMQERAAKINATVHIVSTRGQGTTVSIRFANE
ncbi:MAG: histidine kinase [bacterium]